MLEVNDLIVSYGKIAAVKGISFSVSQGEVITIIGSNGAGKTTTLMAISKILKPSNGRIEFLGTEITHLAPYQILRLGIGLVPEGRLILEKLTIRENLFMGAYIRKDKEGIKNDMDYVLNKFPILKDRIKTLGSTLSGGERQMLAIGRALMSRPKLLMMDEPSLGLAPLVINHLYQTIGGFRKEGTTILLVEQNARKALSVADRGIVMEVGRLTKCDSASSLLMDQDVINAYIGYKR